MGRRAKNATSAASRPAGVQLLLPKLEGGFPDNSFSNIQIGANLIRVPTFHLATTNTVSVTANITQPASTGQQKLLLPKLPMGIRAPSKIIVVNNNERGGQPRVHVINTARSASGVSDESRKRMILTGEINMARNILPKPEPLVLRPRKTLVMSKPTAPPTAVVHAPTPATVSPSKFAIPQDESSDSLQHSRKRPVRKITEDASDGFEVYDEDDGEAAPATLQFQIPQTSPGRTILPKPISTTPQQAQVVFSNGKCNIVPIHPEPSSSTSVSFRNLYSIEPANADTAPDPNDFRHPKRKRSGKKVVLARKASKKQESDTPQEVKRKVGRPTLVHLSTADLLIRLKSDCLSFAADGKNLQCLACRTVLTSNGEAAFSKISKHVHADRGHKALYETWLAKQPNGKKNAEAGPTDVAEQAKGSRWAGLQKKPAAQKPVLKLLTLKRIEVPQILFLNQSQEDSVALSALTDVLHGGPMEEHLHSDMDVVETAVDGIQGKSQPIDDMLYCSGLPAASDEESYASGEEDDE